MSPIHVQKKATLTGHHDSLYTLEAYSTTQFFTAGGDGMVVLWDLENVDTGKMIVKVPASCYALSFSKERNLLVVGQNFSGIHLIDVEAKKEMGSVALTKSAIFDIKTTSERIYVATGEGEVILLDWELRILAKRRFAIQSARCLALSPNGEDLVVGFSNHTFRVLGAVDLSEKLAVQAHANSVFTLCYHPELPILISGSRDARLKFWDVSRGYELVEEVVAHMYAINHVVFSPDHQHFVSCSMDKSIKVWDATHFKLLKVIDRARHAGHGTSVNKLLWMPHEQTLVSCSDDRTVSLWDIQF